MKQILESDWQKIEDAVKAALATDGGHHKQWYLERIARLLGIDISELDGLIEDGIAP